MKQIVLNGSELASEQQLHELLSQTLDFPEWYGRNLDALFDFLTDITDDTEITLVRSDDLIARLGERALLILTVLSDAASENGHIKFSVKN